MPLTIEALITAIEKAKVSIHTTINFKGFVPGPRDINVIDANKLIEELKNLSPDSP